MVRKAIASLTLATLLLATAFADTYGEKISKVDVDKKLITFPVDGKDKTFKVDAEAKFSQQMKAGKRLKIVGFKGGLKEIKAGADATITTERKDGEEVVTKIIINVPAK